WATDGAGKYFPWVPAGTRPSEPSLRRRWNYPRDDHWSAARAGRRQRGGYPVAADTADAAHIRHHPAHIALLGRLVRRRHHLDLIQHPGRALVGGYHLRRISAGPSGPKWPSAHRRLYFFIHRGSVLNH